MFSRYLKIRYDLEAQVTRAADPNDEWDRDDYQYILHSIDGYTCVPENRYFTVTADIVPDENTIFHLVLGRYATGDSFHHESGLVHFVGAYSKKEDAMTVAKAIEDRGSDYNGDYSPESMTIQVPLSNGTVEPIYVGTWMGYFECLESVEIVDIEYFPEYNYSNDYDI